MSKSSKVVMVVVTVAVLAALGLFVTTLLTAKRMTYPITVDLPQGISEPVAVGHDTPRVIDLRVDADNRIYWNDGLVSVEDLQQKMEEEVRKDPAKQPELRIDANPRSDYETLGRILAQAKNAQMKKIGFVQ